MLPQRGNQKQGNAESVEEKSSLVPSISLPKGGGAIRGIDEKFSVNPVTGTGSLSVPIFTSPGRSDFSPKLSLDYDSLQLPISLKMLTDRVMMGSRE